MLQASDSIRVSVCSKVEFVATSAYMPERESDETIHRVQHTPPFTIKKRNKSHPQKRQPFLYQRKLINYINGEYKVSKSRITLDLRTVNLAKNIRHPHTSLCISIQYDEYGMFLQHTCVLLNVLRISNTKKSRPKTSFQFSLFYVVCEALLKKIESF